MFERIALYSLAVFLHAAPSEAATKADSKRSTQAEVKKSVSRRRPPLSMSQLGPEQGLPQSWVNSMVQDALGFIWFGTQEGLGRFDGARMTTYKHDPKKPDSLSASFVTALAVDPDGSLWIGTLEHGLNRYDPSTDAFERYQHDPENPSSLAFNGISSLHIDGDGTLWIGLSNGELNTFDSATESFQHSKILAAVDIEEPGAVSSILKDAAGKLWIGLSRGGLVQFDPKSEQVVHYRVAEPGLSSKEVTVLFEDDEKNLWIGTSGGLNRLDPDRKRFTTFRQSERGSSLSDDRVTIVFQDRRQTIWVGTQHGLNAIDRQSGRITSYSSDKTAVEAESLPQVITAGFQDRGGVIWIGAVGQGVYYFDDLRLDFGGAPSDPVSAILVDRKGKIWTQLRTGMLSEYDRKAERITYYASFGPHALGPWITSLFEDRRGIIWAGVDGKGVFAFDPRAETYKHYTYDDEDPRSLNAVRVDRIVEARDGTLWMATWGGGLSHFDPETETFTSFTKAEEDGASISSNHIYTIMFDRTDPTILLVGAGSGGFNRFDTKTGKATVYLHDESNATSLSHNDVVSVYQEDDGTIWLGTYGGGLNRFDAASGKFKRYTTAEGLPNDTVYCIVPGNSGQLWMSTNGGGLVMFDKTSESFVQYTTADGLQGMEYNQNACVRTKMGEVIFGGVRGLNAFFPQEIKRDAYVPPVVVTRFQLFSQDGKLPRPIWTKPTIDLGYRDSVFSFEFAALSFAGFEKNRYAYKLDGLHDEWIESDRRFVTYTNLDGGDYVFRVKASNRHGVWNEDAISIPVQVDPPPWKRWWAYALYLLAVAGTVAGFVRRHKLKVAELEMQNRLLEVEHNLELTGAVQTGFLPKENYVENGRFRLFGFYRPADQASGDWWYYSESKPGYHLILVGDVTGHGPGPAMVTAAAGTAFRVSGKIKELTMQECLQQMNDEILAVGQGKYHMTMSAVELDDATGKFIMHSAGGLPVLCIGRKGKPTVVGSRGMLLGSSDFAAGTVEGQLKPGDRMIVLTDGIPELNLPSGRLLGMREFMKIYQSTLSIPIADAAKRIVEQADVARGPMPQTDDWTFAIVEYIGDGLPLEDIDITGPAPFEPEATRADRPGRRPSR